MTAELPANAPADQAPVLDAEQARVLTDQIKLQVSAVWELITQAYIGRVWTALGYESWDVYCIKEFGTSRLRIPREERTEMVHSLRQAGLSLRATASATGLHPSTISRDLSRVANATPADGDIARGATSRHVSKKVARRAKAWAAHVAQVGETPPLINLDEDAQAEQLIAAEASRPVPFTMPMPMPMPMPPTAIIGMDGKRYQPDSVRVRVQNKSRRRPFPDSVDRVTWEVKQATRHLDGIIERLNELTEDLTDDDDRIRANRDRLTPQREQLIRLRDQLDEVIARLEGPDAGD